VNAPIAGSGPDTYSALLVVISHMRPARYDDEREVHWLDDEEQLGVSRDGYGRIEIFLRGPQLECRSAAVATNLAYDTWQRAAGDRLVANRLRLPAEPHFDAIAAFFCTHLLDNGVLSDMQLGFRRSEPVIEIAYERSRLQGESLVGLCGELLVLRSMIDCNRLRTRDVLASWFGYRRSARDFQLAAVGVEVKTTQGSRSTHKVQGVRQVEVGHGVGQAFEEQFHLISIGVEAVRQGELVDNTWTLPSLVEGVMQRAHDLALPAGESDELILQFLRNVHAYGASEGEGYNHDEMKHRVVFGQRWRTAFVRMYDMTDPVITVLRSTDLVPFAMVDPASVEFTISLPVQVRGDINPVVGLNLATERVHERAWG